MAVRLARPVAPQRPVALGLAAVALLATVAGDASAQRIEGRVVDEVGEPVVGAEIYLHPLDGRALAASIADAEGHFVIEAPQPGTFLIRATRYGYRAATDTVRLAAGETIAPTIRLSTTPVPVDSIVVSAERGGAEWGVTQFERRRAHGTGVFLDHEWILGFDPLWTQDVFYEVPGVAVRLTMPGKSNPSGQFLMALDAPHHCVAQRLNNLPPPRGMPLEHLLDPDDVMGVEAYRHPREVPPELNYHGMCALVIYWTRGAWSPDTPPGPGINLGRRGVIGITAVLLLLLLI